MKKNVGSRLGGTATVLAAALLLTACTEVVTKHDIEQPPLPTAEERGVEAADLVRFSAGEAIVELEADMSDLMRFDFDRGEDVPAWTVGPNVVDDMPILELLRLLVEPYGVSVVPSPGLSQRSVTLIDPNKRSLGSAIELITRQAGLFWRYEDGVLLIEDKRNFTLRVPNKNLVFDLIGAARDNGQADLAGGAAIEPMSRALADQFEQMGAEDVALVESSRILSFRADWPTYRRIAALLNEIVTDQEVIVYDAWIYQVNLSARQGAGINWDVLWRTDGESGSRAGQGSGSPIDVLGAGAGALGTVSGTPPISAMAQTAAGAVSFGIVAEVGNWVFGSLLDFIDRQGEVKALARPTVAVKNGRVAKLRVGESQEYIRELSSTIDADGEVTSESTDVQELQTGITMVVAGDHNNGVIDTTLNLVTRDLLEFVTFETATGSSAEDDDTAEGQNGRNTTNSLAGRSVSLRLPRTADREFRIEFQARPGDLIVLSGLIREQASYNGSDLIGTGIPTARASDMERSELVILMRPRLVRIVPSAETELPKQRSHLFDPGQNDRPLLQLQPRVTPDDEGARSAPRSDAGSAQRASSRYRGQSGSPTISDETEPLSSVPEAAVAPQSASE